MTVDSLNITTSYAQAKIILADILHLAHQTLAREHPRTAEVIHSRWDELIALDPEKICDGIIRNLSDPKGLEKAVAELATIKSMTRLTFQDFEVLQRSFVTSLAYFFGEDWDGDLAATWTSALSTVASALQLVVAGKQNTLPLIRPDESRGIPPITKTLNLAKPDHESVHHGILGRASSAADPSPERHVLLRTGYALPSSVVTQIRSTAHTIVRDAIAGEFTVAVQNEIQQYMQKGLDSILEGSQFSHHVESLQHSVRREASRVLENRSDAEVAGRSASIKEGQESDGERTQENRPKLAKWYMSKGEII